MAQAYIVSMVMTSHENKLASQIVYLVWSNWAVSLKIWSRLVFLECVASINHMVAISNLSLYSMSGCVHTSFTGLVNLGIVGAAFDIS